MPAGRVAKKTFEHDGVSYTLGRLSYKQVEDFFGGGKKAKFLEVAAASLTNGEGGEPWTDERVQDEFDPQIFDLMMSDIDDFNKLGWKVKKDAGETPAADSTSSKSVAES